MNTVYTFQAPSPESFRAGDVTEEPKGKYEARSPEEIKVVQASMDATKVERCADGVFKAPPSATKPSTERPFYAGKRVNAKTDTVSGTSSRTTKSKIEDEPFGFASRWTQEEVERKKVIWKGLKEAGESDWEVV